MSNIDLNDLANNPKLRLSITSSQMEDPKDASMRRFKEIVLFTIAVVLVLSTFTFCGYLLISDHTSIDDKKWATALD